MTFDQLQKEYTARFEKLFTEWTAYKIGSPAGKKITAFLSEMATAFYEAGKMAQLEERPEGNIPVREYRMKLAGRKEGFSLALKKVRDELKRAHNWERVFAAITKLEEEGV